MLLRLSLKECEEKYTIMSTRTRDNLFTKVRTFNAVSAGRSSHLALIIPSLCIYGPDALR